jgi:hypothetical protein
LIGFAAQIRRSSLTGSYVMETAEHREPCESRGSRTVLGAPGGEIPPGDSTIASRVPMAARPSASAVPPIATVNLGAWPPSQSAIAQSRCAPARCAGAGAERPVASREDTNSRWRAPS